MNNPTRFLIGILLSFVVIASVILLIIIFSPIAVAGILLFSIIGLIAIPIILILLYLTFIWYLSRKEPEKGKSNKNYSIKQGKEVK